MGKVTKQIIKIKLPDGKHAEHLDTALSIANAYRVSRGEPVMNMERFCLNGIIAEANNVTNFYVQEMGRIKKEQEEANAKQSEQVVENVESNSQTTSTTVTNTDSEGQANG